MQTIDETILTRNMSTYTETVPDLVYFLPRQRIKLAPFHSSALLYYATVLLTYQLLSKKNKIGKEKHRKY